MEEEVEGGIGGAEGRSCEAKEEILRGEVRGCPKSCRGQRR